MEDGSREGNLSTQDKWDLGREGRSEAGNPSVV